MVEQRPILVLASGGASSALMLVAGNSNRLRRSGEFLEPGLNGGNLSGVERVLQGAGKEDPRAGHHLRSCAGRLGSSAAAAAGHWNQAIETEQPVSRRDSGSSANGRFASLSVVSALEIPGEAYATEAAEVFQRKLDETTMFIRELQGAQNERLSSRPPPNMICLLGPSYKEIQLADKVTSNLKELAQQVAPGDIVSIPGLRKAMGISVPFPASEDSFIDLTADFEESRKVASLSGS